MAPGSPGHGDEGLVGNKKQVDPTEPQLLPREDWEGTRPWAGGREPLLNTEGVGGFQVSTPAFLPDHFQEAHASGLPVNQHSEATVGETALHEGHQSAFIVPVLNKSYQTSIIRRLNISSISLRTFDHLSRAAEQLVQGSDSKNFAK